MQDELERMETEEKELRAKLLDIQNLQEPMHRVSQDAKKFVQTWTDVGELLDQVTPDERFQILQHYVEVVELRATDEKGKTGKYVLRLFTEVRPHRDPEGGEGATLPPPPPPETPNGAVTDAGNDPDLLTEDGQVRMTVQKAPRGGRKPDGFKLTEEPAMET